MVDRLELFQKTMNDYASNKYLQNHLLELLEHLYKDLENERSTTANLRQQIQEMSKNTNFGITSKFVELKAAYTELQQKLISLKDENDDLNIQLIGKGEEVKRLLFENEEKIKSYFQKQLNQKEELIKQKEREVENSKDVCKQREQQLYEEIHTAEAVSAMELDKVETNFRKQLVEANKKLKESMDTCNVLRNELMSVKEQFMEYKRISNQKISELQKRLTESLTCEGAPVYKKSSDTLSVAVEEKNNSKYQPLDINYSNFLVSEDNPLNLKKIPVYRSSGKFFCNNSNNNNSNISSNRKNNLPPLINVTTPITKRRKLFNPDDLAYLNSDDFDKKVVTKFV